MGRAVRRRAAMANSPLPTDAALYAGVMADHLVTPYGGVLVDSIVDDERASELRKTSTD